MTAFRLEDLAPGMRLELDIISSLNLLVGQSRLSSDETAADRTGKCDVCDTLSLSVAGSIGHSGPDRIVYSDSSVSVSTAVDDDERFA